MLKQIYRNKLDTSLKLSNNVNQDGQSLGPCSVEFAPVEFQWQITIFDPERIMCESHTTIVSYYWLSIPLYPPQKNTIISMAISGI